MIEHVMPMCLTISWVYTIAMLVQSIVYEKEKRLKEVIVLLQRADIQLKSLTVHAVAKTLDIKHLVGTKWFFIRRMIEVISDVDIDMYTNCP